VTFAVGVREDVRIEGADTSWGLLTTKGGSPKYYEGSLSIDLYDRSTRRHVWHGWGREPLDRGADAKAVIDEAVAEIMKHFPPETGKSG
jgi:DNA-binding protein H-NS